MGDESEGEATCPGSGDHATHRVGRGSGPKSGGAAAIRSLGRNTIIPTGQRSSRTPLPVAKDPGQGHKNTVAEGGLPLAFSGSPSRLETYSDRSLIGHCTACIMTALQIPCILRIADIT